MNSKTIGATEIGSFIHGCLRIAPAALIALLLAGPAAAQTKWAEAQEYSQFPLLPQTPCGSV